MPKLNDSGNLRNTITNDILKLPVIPAGAFSIIQDSVQDGRQNVITPKIIWQMFLTGFSILLDIIVNDRKKSIKIWPLRMEEKLGFSKMVAIGRENR